MTMSAESRRGRFHRHAGELPTYDAMTMLRPPEPSLAERHLRISASLRIPALDR